MMRKNPHAQALGRLGGLKGGQSKSPAKRAASQQNAAKARAVKAFKAIEADHRRVQVALHDAGHPGLVKMAKESL